MSRTYSPRRCSARWLDGDCPDGVLCIMDNPQFADRYTVIYSRLHVVPGLPFSYYDSYLFGRGMSEDPRGIGMAFEMKPHEVAAYRYRNKHRYCKWTDLPEKVQACVRADLEESQ